MLRGAAYGFRKIGFMGLNDWISKKRLSIPTAGRESIIFIRENLY